MRQVLKMPFLLLDRVTVSNRFIKSQTKACQPVVFRVLVCMHGDFGIGIQNPFPVEFAVIQMSKHEICHIRKLQAHFSLKCRPATLIHILMNLNLSLFLSRELNGDTRT